MITDDHHLHTMAPSYLLITLLFTFTATLVHSQEDESEEAECKNRHCEAGFFCYKETFRCAPCIDCASRFRHNSTFGCHQKASDCGDCLPGYMEPNLEHDVPKESCMPQAPGVITTSKTSASQSGTETVLNYVAFLSGVSVLSLFLIASFLYRWHKERRASPPQETTELQELMVTQQPPPPYSPFAFKSPDGNVSPVPTAPVLESSTLQIDSPRNCDTNIYVEAHRLPPARIREQLVQAALHNPPNWVNTRDYRPDTPQSPTPPSSDDSGDSGAFGDAIHDENTQESHWTPNTSQENVEESATQGAHQEPDNGNEAVGGVEPREDGTRRDTRRRASSEDLEPEPREKRLRSDSPPQQSNFVFLNHNNNQVTLNQMNSANIQINLNLNRSDERRDQEPNPNSLVESEDYFA